MVFNLHGRFGLQSISIGRAMASEKSATGSTDETVIIGGSIILVRGGGSRVNGSEGANAGGPGGKGPLDGSEVSFFKTIQSIRK